MTKRTTIVVIGSLMVKYFRVNFTTKRTPTLFFMETFFVLFLSFVVCLLSLLVPFVDYVDYVL